MARRRTSKCITATPARLDDDSWGAWVTSPYTVTEGLEVQVTARNGRTWYAEVVEIVRTSQGRTLVRTVEA